MYKRHCILALRRKDNLARSARYDALLASVRVSPSCTPTGGCPVAPAARSKCSGSRVRGAHLTRSHSLAPLGRSRRCRAAAAAALPLPPPPQLPCRRRRCAAAAAAERKGRAPEGRPSSAWPHRPRPHCGAALARSPPRPSHRCAIWPCRRPSAAPMPLSARVLPYPAAGRSKRKRPPAAELPSRALWWPSAPRRRPRSVRIRRGTPFKRAHGNANTHFCARPFFQEARPGNRGR